MKAALTFASTLVLVNAQTIETTDNECFKGEGGKYKEECSDAYFFGCDVYEIREKSACNIFVFSDSRITWFSVDIRVHSWDYYLNDGQEDDTEINA